MKKVISTFLIGVMLCLCGCSEGLPQAENSNVVNSGSVNSDSTNINVTASATPTPASTANPAQEAVNGDYVGYWEHTEYPDAYSVIVYEQVGDAIGFVVQANRMNANGMPAQMASVRRENIKIGSQDTHFKFRDSFGNSGMCRLQATSSQLTFTFNVTGEYQANWCIDAGNGTYRKVKKLSELEWFDKEEFELVDFSEEIDYEMWGLEGANQVEGKSYMWYGKYYQAGNDLEYDSNVAYSIGNDGSATKYNHGRTTDGKYYMFESNKNDYDFRILFRFDDGDDFLLYGRTNIPSDDPRRDAKDDITFYLMPRNGGDLVFFGRYLNETYIGTERAVRAANQ